MLEAIFKLLKLEMQIAVAVMTLVSGAVLWLLRTLVRHMWNTLGHSKAQPVPERQDQEVMVAPAAARPQGTVPVVPATPVRPEPSTDRPVAVPSLQHVLAAPDHILYVTSNSGLVIEHPRSEELLEMVDRISVAALHKDGSPFIEAAPDTSSPGGDAGILALEDDPVFMDGEEPRALPVPDGKIWVRRLGTVAWRA